MIEFKDFKLADEDIPSIEELPGDLPEIAEIIGVPQTLKLANRFRGSSVYFHTMDNILRQHRNKAIRKEYDDGVTVPKIARKYRLSVRNIWLILGRD
jgi:Mor family transcriptional regulator